VAAGELSQTLPRGQEGLTIATSMLPLSYVWTTDNAVDSASPVGSSALRKGAENEGKCWEHGWFCTRTRTHPVIINEDQGEDTSRSPGDSRRMIPSEIIRWLDSYTMHWN